MAGTCGKKTVVEEAFEYMEELRKLKGLDWMYYQDDNAPPHTKAWGTKSGQLDLGKEAAKFGIKRKGQSSGSPDFNVMDLVVWRILECSVRKKHPKNTWELWQAIKQAWDEDLPAAKIEMAFRLLDIVMALVAQQEGGNCYKMPHTGLRDEMRADGWDI